MSLASSIHLSVPRLTLPRAGTPRPSGGRRSAMVVASASAAGPAPAATASGAAAAVTSTSKPADVVTVYFRQEGTSTTARPGEDFMDVASRCKADIPTGCLHGSCGVCEVELFKYQVDAESGEAREAGSPVVMRACVAKVPRGWGRVEVGMMAIDQVWGQDGWDT